MKTMSRLKREAIWCIGGAFLLCLGTVIIPEAWKGSALIATVGIFVGSVLVIMGFFILQAQILDVLEWFWETFGEMSGQSASQITAVLFVVGGIACIALAVWMVSGLEFRLTASMIGRGVGSWALVVIGPYMLGHVLKNRIVGRKRHPKEGEKRGLRYLLGDVLEVIVYKIYW